MFLIIVLGDLVVQIPMPVLVGIMIMVSIGTFDWSSFTYIRKAPKADVTVMLVTMAIVVVTSDLSKGVIAGVILSALFFVIKISKIRVKAHQTKDSIVYYVEGQLFFASVDNFVDSFDLGTQGQNIAIDFTKAHVWDDSAVGAIDKIVIKLHEDRKSTRLNSSHVAISYAVFCLKKKKIH